MNLIALELARDQHLVGGKAVNLARLLTAGFAVPGGFVVTTAAYRSCRGDVLTAELRHEIAATYRALGEPVVAVRSSATAEDLAGASMAGQYETVLDVQGAAAVCAAIERCWASVRSARVDAYLRQQRIDPAQVAMAVVIQRLVPSAVAGVLFTVNPRSAAGDELLIEASWGLGEAVVGALVQPDTLVVGRSDGVVRSAVIADKHLAIRPGSHAAQPVEDAQRRSPCLDSAQVEDLRQLGLRVEHAFGGPQDLEWAIADGRLHLLQSRAITTLEASSERLALAEHAALANALANGDGPWVRHNLSETLPHPTPLTWSVIERFMSGAGGFGTLYRHLGFDPAPDQVLRRIGGRLYLDLARGPGLFWAGYPFAYDVERLRANPDSAQLPPDVPTGDASALHAAQRRLTIISRGIATLAIGLAEQLDRQEIPAFRQWVAQESLRDLRVLDAAALHACWIKRVSAVMDGFAPRSLLPSAVCADLQARLRTLLVPWCWDEDPGSVADRVAIGGAPSSTVLATAGLRGVARGELTVPAWLAEHGHRTPGEFDLAAPRWHERPAAVGEYAATLRDAEDPLALHARRVAAAADEAGVLAARMDATSRSAFTGLLTELHRLLRFREDGKHELMRGYDLLRAVALETGRRLGIGDDVFLLEEPEMFQAMSTGYAPVALIGQRRARRQAERHLFLPSVIAAADLPTLGTPPPVIGGDRLPAFPIAAGVGAGPVRIVLDPEGNDDLGHGYVLVCPSTDPAWSPLFINAAALVLERGGALSHGAVVARELGIPAVVLDGACTRLIAGETVTVDGAYGIVLRGLTVDGAADGAMAAVGESAPEQLPMPPGRGPQESRSLRWAGLALGGWVLYLGLAFGFGTWSVDQIYQPSIALLDRPLWPLLHLLGGPVMVGVLAAVMAVVCVSAQRLLTDNARLLMARDRAAALRRRALQMPADDPRKAPLLATANPVQWRVLGAAMVPIGWLLGPMILLIFWLTERIDAPPLDPGTIVQIAVEIDGDYTTALTAEITDGALAGAAIDAAVTPPTQSLPPLRATLIDLQHRWTAAGDLTSDAWELQAAGRMAREATLRDLAAFLAKPLPRGELAWRIVTPALPGRTIVDLRAATGERLVSIPLSTGRELPPAQREVVTRPGQPDKLLPVIRPPHGPIGRIIQIPMEHPAEAPFLRPFHMLGWDWDSGWIALYIAIYLPVMFLTKRLLRVP